MAGGRPTRELSNLIDVARVRAKTPGCSGPDARIHFNNAGASLLPQPVLGAMQEYLELEARIGGYEAAAARADQIAGFYAAAAELLATRPENVAFASSATDAFSRALSAIPFERGDVLLTTKDDYISNQLAFLSLRNRLGIEVVHAPNREGGGVDVDALVELMRRRLPRLVAVTHVPTNSGLVQPVAEIGRACRRLDLLYLVDACQSLGQYPLDVDELGCDFLSATCRKFLRGPRGSGLLFVSDRALEGGLEPLFIDMRGARWLEPDVYRPVPTAARFEDWEFSYAAVVGAAAAIRYALGVGLTVIAERSIALADDLRRRLGELPGVRVLDRGPELCAIVTLTVGGIDADSLHDELERRRINSSVAEREHAIYDFDEKGVDSCLRLSPHYFNTEQEVDEVVAAVREIASRNQAA